MDAVGYAAARIACIAKSGASRQKSCPFSFAWRIGQRLDFFFLAGVLSFFTISNLTIPLPSRVVGFVVSAASFFIVSPSPYSISSTDSSSAGIWP
jgi:hypothetical protein